MLLLLRSSPGGSTVTYLGSPASSYVPSNSIPTGLGTGITTAQDAFFGSAGQLYRRVDIHNADGTLWYSDAPVVEGSVSVSYDRAERRTFDLTLDNEDFIFRSDPAGFWYDKIIKIYRGAQVGNDTQYYQLGEFLIDTISSPNFPALTKIAGRDYAKMLMQTKFSEATGFVVGQSLDAIVRAIALNGGVTKVNVPTTGKSLTSDIFFDGGSPRWDAIAKLANDYGYELFFDAMGVLIMRPFVDPTTAPISYTFATGSSGNLGSYELKTNDTRIFNHVVVKGSGNSSLPVYGYAENTEPSSPTRIARIGRRTMVYDSKFISDSNSATALAVALLKIYALESYEISVGSLTAPWMEVGTAIRFNDPNPAPAAPDRFLLTDITIPLAPGLMTGTAKRITIVH